MKTFCESENKQLEKLRNFKLPNQYKKIGFLIFGLALGIVTIFKFIEGEPAWSKTLLTQIMLLGLLTVSLAREKEEDEMIVLLRSQSYSVAFFIGVLYAVIQPYANYVAALLFKPEKASLDMGYFQVLFFMLLVQLMYFYKLKRRMV